jgi:WD40 repeat protein
MKVRSVKLREAHKAAAASANNGRGSFCSVLWDQQALHLVTASSSDPSISIHDPLQSSGAPKILRHHRDGVTALAISPNSTCLASGSVDHSVKLYKFPGILWVLLISCVLSMGFAGFRENWVRWAFFPVWHLSIQLFVSYANCFTLYWDLCRN